MSAMVCVLPPLTNLAEESTSVREGGRNGQASGLDMIPERASLEMTSPEATSMVTRVGMPCTPNLEPSCRPTGDSKPVLRPHGISRRYPSKSDLLRSEETKITSAFLDAACFVYQLASMGVNILHGGHQWAEK
jgi:hypothetical protein